MVCNWKNSRTSTTGRAWMQGRLLSWGKWRLHAAGFFAMFWAGNGWRRATSPWTLGSVWRRQKCKSDHCYIIITIASPSYLVSSCFDFKDIRWIYCFHYVHQNPQSYFGQVLGRPANQCDGLSDGLTAMEKGMIIVQLEVQRPSVALWAGFGLFGPAWLSWPSGAQAVWPTQSLPPCLPLCLWFIWCVKRPDNAILGVGWPTSMMNLSSTLYKWYKVVAIVNYRPHSASHWLTG